MCSTCGCRKAEENSSSTMMADIREMASDCSPTHKKRAESADPNKTTTSLNARFFVGKGDGNDLRGKGKFMKYNDAVAKAKDVAEKEGKSRVVSNRGFALWTHDGKGLFQEGKSTAEAKKYYRAEDGSVDMDAYADDYMMAEDGFFEAESFGAEVAYAVMWEGKEDDNEGLIYGIEYMDGDEVSDVEWFSTKEKRDGKLKSYIKEFGKRAESFEAESKFDKLSDEIAAQYRKKGKSPAEAERIGKATAYKIGVRKYGKAGMTRKARRGMRAESFEAEGMRSMTPLVTLGLIGAGVLLASKMRTNMEKKESQGSDCGCHGKDHSDQEMRAEGLPVQNVKDGVSEEMFGDVGEGNDFGQMRAESYPQTFDRAQDFLPRYRYPEDSDWSNDYNPADPFRPLDYQRVQTKGM